MTEKTQLSPASVDPLAKRATDFAKSEMFERTFKEGMGLVEETAAYLDGPGRAASKRLSRSAALAYAGESMRLTTRLMQVASWLLVQKAVREGEIPVKDATGEKYRMISREIQPAPAFAGSEELPEALKALIVRGSAIYERVKRLDEVMYGEGSDEAPAGSGLSDQVAKLNAAFGR